MEFFKLILGDGEVVQYQDGMLKSEFVLQDLRLKSNQKDFIQEDAEFEAEKEETFEDYIAEEKRSEDERLKKKQKEGK